MFIFRINMKETIWKLKKVTIYFKGLEGEREGGKRRGEREIERERKRDRETDIFYLLIHFSNTSNRLSWFWSKPGT